MGWQDDPIVDEAPAASVPAVRAAKPVKLNEQMAKYTLYSQARSDLDEIESIIATHGTPDLIDTALEGIKSTPSGAGGIGGALTGGGVGARLGGSLGPQGALVGGAIGAGVGGVGGLLTEPVIRPLANYLQGAGSQRYFAASGRLRDSLEKAMTGAASSEREALGYMTNMIPSFGDDPKTVLSKVQAMRIRLHSLESLGKGMRPEELPMEERPLPDVGPPEKPGLLEKIGSYFDDGVPMVSNLALKAMRQGRR